MTVVAYVSGHGLGHSAREVEILRHLPESVPLIVKTIAPEWFWRDNLQRPFERIPDSFDVGCVQLNGLDVDVPGTLAALREMNERNRPRYDAEADFLRACGARLVVSDVPSLPLVAAGRAGVPSVCVVNFTWADVYRHYLREQPEFGPLAEVLEAEYRRATLAVFTGFALPMDYFPRREDAGLVARSGTDRRVELLARLPEPARGRRLALVYVGGWGLPIPYERASAFTDWHFVSLDAPPVVPENWTVLPRDLMSHPDLVASVDLVVSKPGYGVAGECLANGTPLLYPPRPAFIEYFALDRDLEGWPGRLPADSDRFLSLEWRAFLEKVPTRGSVARRPSDGAVRAANAIHTLYRHTSKHVD